MSFETEKKVMVVADDYELGRTVIDTLQRGGFACDLVDDSMRAIEMTRLGNYQLVLLDVALEDDSGLAVLRRILEANDDVNVVVIAPLNFQQERLAALEAGADDFIIKPFSAGELIARVDAAKVRSRSKPDTVLEIGSLKMDLANRRVVRDGKPILLTPTEFRILEILLRNQGRVVTRRMLCEFLWNPDWEGVTNVIEVHINRLRTKLRQAGAVRLIHTVRGSGYVVKWSPEDDEESPRLARVNGVRMEEASVSARANL